MSPSRAIVKLWPHPHTPSMPIPLLVSHIIENYGIASPLSLDEPSVANKNVAIHSPELLQLQRLINTINGCAEEKMFSLLVGTNTKYNMQVWFRLSY